MGSCDTIEWDMGQGAWDTGRVDLSANRQVGRQRVANFGERCGVWVLTQHRECVKKETTISLDLEAKGHEKMVQDWKGNR